MFVRGANNAVVLGKEVKFDKVANLRLGNVWLETVIRLRFVVSHFSIAAYPANREYISRTFPTDTVRVIESRLEVEGAELEAAGADVTAWPFTSDSSDRSEDSTAKLLSRYILSTIPTAFDSKRCNP